MKRIIKSFMFWGAILSLLVILVQQLGYDSKSISLIYLNPILNALTNNEATLSFMQTGYPVSCRNLVAGNTISIYWYIGSMVTCLFYGGVLDLMRFGLKKLLHSSRKKST